MQRWLLTLAVMALASVTAVTQAVAQGYPNRPIRVIVPFTAGSGTDIIARTVMEQVSQQLGQPIVVENRGGAAGTIGIGTVAKAEPDGYTLLVQSTSFAVTATTYSNPGYNARTAFAGITALTSVPNVMIVQPNKFKNVADVVAYGKANPGKLNYASGGAGSAAHLNGERFLMATGLKMTHLPYPGGPQGLASVVQGDSVFYFIPLPASRGLVASGKLAILAVSGSKRSSLLPDVPTTIEAGFPNSEYDFWVGFWAPAKTPKEIVERLNAETVKALANPKVIARLNKAGSEPMPMKPAEFENFVKKEIDVNADLVKAAGIKIN